MTANDAEVDLPNCAVTYFQPDYDANSVVLMAFCSGERYILEARLADFQAVKDDAAEFAKRLDRSRQIEEQLDPDDDLSYEAQVELEDWMLKPFESHLPAARNSESATEQSWTLGQCFSPKTSCYRLTVDDSKVLTYRKQDMEPPRKVVEPYHLAAREVFTLQQQNTLKAFKPDQLVTEWNRSKQLPPPWNTKVYYKESNKTTEEYFFKYVEEGQEKTFSREVTALLSIQRLLLESDSSDVIRIPEIVGYVEHEIPNIAGEIAGLLLQHVDADETMYFLCRPRDKEKKTPNAERRTKWQQQVTAMVKWLHQHDLIWGDAKAENVLIDKHDDAWLIDFGGGYTPGWVDEKKGNSVAGDLQGLEKIESFLAGEDIQDAGSFSSSQVNDEADGNGLEDDQLDTTVDDSPASQRQKRRRIDDSL